MKIMWIITQSETKGTTKVIVTAEQIFKDYQGTDFNSTKLQALDENTFNRAVKTFELKRFWTIDMKNDELVEKFKKKLHTQHGITVKDLSVVITNSNFDEMMDKLRIVVSNNIDEYEKPGSGKA